MLPASEGWLPLHPVSPVFKAGRISIATSVVLLQVVGFPSSLPLLAAAAVPVFVCLAGVYVYLSWAFTRFRTGGDQFELREGVLFRTQKRVPLARLESVDIARPLLARVLGLAELRLEVAGSAGSEVRLRYLSERSAVELRAGLLGAKAAAGNAPIASQPGDAPIDLPIASVKTVELILGTVAVPATALACGALISAALLPLAPEVAIPLALALLGTGLGVGIATAVFVERSLNFRLSESTEGLVARRGLVNLLTQKVPLDRVQAVRVESPLLWRPWKRSRLVVDVAGYGGGSVDVNTTSVLLPIGDRTAVRAVVAHVLPGVDPIGATLQPSPHSARWRSPFVWRSYGVAVLEDYSISRRGLFRQRVDIVPHRKVQSVRITQGPWQRLLRLASVHLDTAGPNLDVVAKHRNEADAHFIAAEVRRLDLVRS